MSNFAAGNYNLELGKKTYIMGILNVTPDSFSDGGKYNDIDSALKRAIEIQEQGADIIDIGAQSTRPGFKQISAAEELKRILPVLEAVRKKINIPISIDTFYPEVAKAVLDLGADIINDVFGFEFDAMLSLAEKSNCGLIILYPRASVSEIKPFFEYKLSMAMKHSINQNRLCFDPGIGFEKNYEDDIQAIKRIREYRINDCAILVGASRKRLVNHFCNDNSIQKRLPGTIAAHTIAILNGADIIRVHDVEAAVSAASLTDKFKNIP